MEDFEQWDAQDAQDAQDDELAGFEVDYLDQAPSHPDLTADRDYPDGTILHFSMRLHFKRRFLSDRCPRRLMETIILEYARIFQIEVLNYAIMDNHVHLIVRLRPESGRAHKMVGLIKQRFTHKFKHWYNTAYRRSKKYRIPALGKGTLWESRPDPKVVDDPGYLVNCVLYVEQNRLKAVRRDAIEALTEPPALDGLAEEEWLDCLAAVEESDYGELLEAAACWPHHSAAYWLDPYDGEARALTDGTDACWATGEELDRHARKRVEDLPDGWRKVWVGLGRTQYRLLKTTPPEERSLPHHPVWHALGDDTHTREGRFRVLMAWGLWRTKDPSAADLTDLPRELMVNIRVGPPRTE